MCLECGDTGLLYSAPDGETVYCEECVPGLTKALGILEAHLELDAAWLDRQRGEGAGVEWEQGIYELELQEHERLEGLLREKRHEGEFVEMEGC